MNTKRAIKQLKELKKYSASPRLAAESWQEPWKILISTMLSARTRDVKTIPVAENLFKKYPTIKKLYKANFSSIAGIIKPVNFYKTKAKNVLKTARIIAKNKDKIPHDIDELIKLPGVGRKTANIFLAEMGKDAIGVDTHVSYISRYLKWTRNKNPYKIEKDLEKLFPRRYWNKINSILVKFGQSHSKKEKHRILNRIKRIK